MKSRIVNILAIVLSVSFVLLPTVVQAADIEITEVMYDLAGSDADREWIEIYNNSGQDIDLDDWHFLENDTNHFINPSTDGGNTTLASGAYAVIADDPEAFSSDHSGFSGLLLDSTFSLSNDGEPLAITDPDESVVSSLSYDPADGGSGDGLSLQLQSGEWISAEPTPGQANATTEASVSTDDSDDDSGSGSSGSSGMDIMEPRESSESSDNNSSQSVSLDAGSDIDAVAGVHARFTGQVSGVSDDDLEASWSFGNADVKEGRDIFYTYDYPGEYVATFSLNYDGNTYSDSITVDVVSPNISIEEVTAGQEGYVSLDNQVGRDVDLSGWHLRAGGDTFTLPKNTIHLRGETLTITNKTSGLSGGSAELLFPNGSIATTSEPTNSTNSEPVVYNSSNNSAGGSSANSTETEEPTSTATSNEMSLSDAFATSGQSAAVGTAGGGESRLFWRWAGMLTLLIISAIGTIVILARYTRPEDDPQVQAARFDINEM